MLPKLKRRPKHFENEQELLDYFHDYLEECESNNKIANVAGFACYCYCAKLTLLRYKEETHEFCNAMKLIYSFLENETINEQKMSDNFKKFYMTNTFEGYSDKQQIESKNENTNKNFDYTASVDMQRADVQKIIRLLKEEKE